MTRSFQIASLATILAMLSLYLWSAAFKHSDWAVLALIPLATVILVGSWQLALEHWTAQLRIALRPNSSVSKWFTGKIRATLISVGFTILAVVLTAWQAISASAWDAVVMVGLFFLSALVYCFAQSLLLTHIFPPFSRVFAASVATWLVAVPGTLALTWTVWAYTTIPAEFLDANFQEALIAGRKQIPPRDGWLPTLLSVPVGYESAKLWAVVKLRDYPILGFIFSIDAALSSFVLCRTGAVVAQFIEAHVLQTSENLEFEHTP